MINLVASDEFKFANRNNLDIFDHGYSVNNTDLFVDIDNGQVFVSNEDNPNGLEITQNWMHVSFSEDYYNNPEENSFINSENEIIIAAEFIPFSIQDKYNADLEDGGFILTSENNHELSSLQIQYFSDEGVIFPQIFENFRSDKIVDIAEEVFNFDLNNDGIKGGNYEPASISNNAEKIDEFEFANRHNLEIFNSNQQSINITDVFYDREIGKVFVSNDGSNFLNLTQGNYEPNLFGYDAFGALKRSPAT